MMPRLVVACAVLFVALGCDNASQKAEREPAPAKKSPSLDAAITDLKESIHDTAEAAKKHIAENAGDELERVFGEMQDIAGDFGEHADQLKGDAKKQYDEMRMDYEEKKDEFEQTLKKLKEGSSDEKQELLKRLYDALTGMKTALDKAAEAFRENAPAPAEAS